MKLVYPGKSAPGEIVRHTPSSVLKPVKIVGDIRGNRWHNRMIVGNNRRVLKTLLKYKEEGILRNKDGSAGVRLVYIDPPFGTGDVYDRDRVGIYSARLKGPPYLEWLRTRIVLLRELLTEDGSFYLRTDYHFGHYVKVLLDEIFGQDNFRNEIIVNRTRKVFDGVRRFNVATDTLFFYTRTADHVFNGFTRPRKKQKWVPMHSPGIRWTRVDDSHLPFYRGDMVEKRKGGVYSRGRVFEGKVWFPPEGRHWTFSQARLERYAARGRIRINPKTGVLEYLTSPREIVDSNWTDIPGYSFKWSFPSENSEALLERVIGSSSGPGDVVLDAFAGSGTSGAVAEKMGRRWIMIDSSRTSAYTVFRRMVDLKRGIGNRGRTLKPSPFAIYRAHPRRRPRRRPGTISPPEIHPRLAADLFGFKYSPFSMNGTEFIGKRRGTPVLLFNPGNGKWTEAGHPFFREMHNQLGGRFTPLYVIVPEGKVPFLEDVVVLEGTEYHILRLPYSVFLDPPAGTGPGSVREIVESARFEVV
ncbi:MAG: DNA methyltransferase, partial [Fidelibacterota bacterium]